MGGCQALLRSSPLHSNEEGTLTIPRGLVTAFVVWRGHAFPGSMQAHSRAPFLNSNMVVGLASKYGNYTDLLPLGNTVMEPLVSATRWAIRRRVEIGIGVVLEARRGGAPRLRG